MRVLSSLDNLAFMACLVLPSTRACLGNLQGRACSDLGAGVFCHHAQRVPGLIMLIRTSIRTYMTG